MTVRFAGMMVVLAWGCFAADEVEPPGKADVAVWITQLGSKAFERREEAIAALEKMGERVREALEHAHETSVDPELRFQAGVLLGTLDGPLTITVRANGTFWMNGCEFALDDLVALIDRRIARGEVLPISIEVEGDLVSGNIVNQQLCRMFEKRKIPFVPACPFASE